MPLRLILRRAAGFVAVVFASSAVFGGLLWAAPGAAGLTEGDGFLSWLGGFWLGVVTGDMGTSYRGLPIATMVVQGAERSLPILAGALAASLGTGLTLALLLPRSAGRWPRALRSGLHALSLVPVFLLGYLALVVFAVPPDGGARTLAAVLILALGDGTLTDVVLGLDAEVEALRERDFVQSARLRGLPLALRLVPHIALPLARLAASKMAFLLGGILVLEMVLGIQGLGLMGYRAATRPDFPLLLAIAVFSTALVAGAHLGVDLLRIAVDPRARKDRRRAARGVLA